MSRNTNLFFFVICIVLIVLTYTMPFIQKDLYTVPNFFDLFTGKKPRLITSDAILQGQYYRYLLGISIGYLVLQALILFIRDSKLTAFISAALGLFGLLTIIVICLTLQNDNIDRNFSFLYGFYIFIISLFTKNLIDWLYLRTAIQKPRSGKSTDSIDLNNQTLDT